jgi:hypothetical protein
MHRRKSATQRQTHDKNDESFRALRLNLPSPAMNRKRDAEWKRILKTWTFPRIMSVCPDVGLRSQSAEIRQLPTIEASKDSRRTTVTSLLW